MIYPNEVILETTNYCNLNCQFCHFHGPNAKVTREKGFINEKLWKKVIDEIGKWPKKCTLVTHGAGEPLLYKDIDKLLIYAKRFPNLFVGFMTNGMLLDEKFINFLFDIKIDWVSFSIDGTDPVAHKNYRKGSDLAIIEKNLNRLLEIKNKNNVKYPMVLLNMVVYPDFEYEKENFVNKWVDKVDKITLSTFRPIGSRKLTLPDKAEFTSCKLLYNQMVVSYDGKVGLCCEDIFLDIELGDANKQNLLDIYNNEKINLIRKDHEGHNLSGLKLCSDCDVWGSSLIIETKQTDSFYYEKTPAYEGYTRK